MRNIIFDKVRQVYYLPTPPPPDHKEQNLMYDDGINIFKSL